MKFAKLLFWVAFIIGLVIFSVNSWQSVTLSVGLDSVLVTKLPVLVILSLLIGFLPLYIWHHIIKWRLTKKLNAANAKPANAKPANAPLNMRDIGKPQTHQTSANQAESKQARDGISPLESKTTLESE